MTISQHRSIFDFQVSIRVHGARINKMSYTNFRRLVVSNYNPCSTHGIHYEFMLSPSCWGWSNHPTHRSDNLPPQLAELNSTAYTTLCKNVLCRTSHLPFWRFAVPVLAWFETSSTIHILICYLCWGVWTSRTLRKEVEWGWRWLWIVAATIPLLQWRSIAVTDQLGPIRTIFGIRFHQRLSYLYTISFTPQ